MRRREFIKGMAGSAAIWPSNVRAQQTALPRLGFLSSRSTDESKHLVAAFRAGLESAGRHVDGQNVAIVFRWAEGQYARLPELAADLVRQDLAVLVAVGSELSARAAEAATSSVPIVFSVGDDPVKAGLVASYNRPGGNATGVSLLTTASEAKRLGLLNELVPGGGVLGVLIDPNYAQVVDQAQAVKDAASALGRQVQIAHAGDDAGIEAAFAGLAEKRVVALLVTADPFFDTRRQRIVALAAQYRLPAIYQFRDYAVAGGLMSYGIAIADGYRQVGIYAGQILDGAKPAELPIYQSIKFELVINLKTAKALGIKISDNLVSIADEVIE
jgi:putative tryptophan/tyrosine transport system substrate-binding protein